MTTTSSNPKLIRRCIAEVNAEPVDWLWPNRIATKVNVLAGHPGLGKSQISIAIAATVSIGGTWPDDTECRQGSVIFISSEDDAGDTIKPRLEAAGADTRRIHVIDAVLDNKKNPRSWQLADHAVIGKLLTELGDVRLIIIDPITAYLGNGDGHSTSDVRGLLAPLMDMASRHKFAVLAISHLNKSGGDDAVTRVTGSLAYVAAARAAYVVGRHPTDDNARCLAPLKNNLGDDKTGFGYRVVNAISHDGFDTSRIEWLGAIEVSADDVLSKPAGKPVDIEANSAKGDAAAFLFDMLKDGPIASTDVYEQAEAAEIAKRTLTRAKKALHIRSVKIEGASGWYMKLPERKKPDSGQECQSTSHLTLDTLGTLGTLDDEEGQECQQCQGPERVQVGPLAIEEDQGDGVDGRRPEPDSDTQ